jgi:serine/threonine protein kinase
MADEPRVGLCDWAGYLCGCIADDYDDHDDAHYKGGGSGNTKGGGAGKGKGGASGKRNTKQTEGSIDSGLMRSIDSRTFRESYAVHERIHTTRQRSALGSPREEDFVMLRRVTHRTNGQSYACKIVDVIDNEVPQYVTQEILALQALQKMDDLSESEETYRNFCCSCFSRYEDEEEIEREYQELGMGNADSICKLVDQFFNVTECRAYMLLELTTHTLRKYIDEGITKVSDNELRYAPMPEEQVKEIALRLLDALEYIHKRKIVHRDIHPESIVFVANEQYSTVKLANFGQSMVLDKRSKRRRRGRRKHEEAEVTHSAVGYVDPVAQHCSRPQTSTDIWALGIVLFELFDGSVPFRAEHFGGDGYFALDFQSWGGGVSDGGMNFIECMLQLAPRDRWNAARAKKHAWFTGADLDLAGFARAVTYDTAAVANARTGRSAFGSSQSSSSWTSWSGSERSNSCDFYSSFGSAYSSGDREPFRRRISRERYASREKDRSRKGLKASLIEEGEEEEEEGEEGEEEEGGDSRDTYRLPTMSQIRRVSTPVEQGYIPSPVEQSMRNEKLNGQLTDQPGAPSILKQPGAPSTISDQGSGRAKKREGAVKPGKKAARKEKADRC